MFVMEDHKTAVPILIESEREHEKALNITRDLMQKRPRTSEKTRKNFAVHHIHDGVCEDRSEEAFGAAMTSVADAADPITFNMYCAIEMHVSTQAANLFARA